MDECADINCTEHSHCVNMPGSYDCECDPGYMANGSVCMGMLRSRIVNFDWSIMSHDYSSRIASVFVLDIS